MIDLTALGAGAAAAAPAATPSAQSQSGSNPFATLLTALLDATRAPSDGAATDAAAETPPLPVTPLPGAAAPLPAAPLPGAAAPPPAAPLLDAAAPRVPPVGDATSQASGLFQALAATTAAALPLAAMWNVLAKKDHGGDSGLPQPDTRRKDSDTDAAEADNALGGSAALADPQPLADPAVLAAAVAQAATPAYPPWASETPSAAPREETEADSSRPATSADRERPSVTLFAALQGSPPLPGVQPDTPPVEARSDPAPSERSPERSGVFPFVPRSPQSAPWVNGGATPAHDAPHGGSEAMTRLIQASTPVPAPPAPQPLTVDPTVVATDAERARQFAAFSAPPGAGHDRASSAPAPGASDRQATSGAANPGGAGFLPDITRNLTGLAPLASASDVTAPAVLAAFARAVARASGSDLAQIPLSRNDRGSLTSGTVTVPIAVNGATVQTLAADSLALAAPASEMVGINDGALERQIVRAIRMQWQNGVGEATIKLEPPHLGSLTVSLKVDGGAVAASVRTDTVAAQQWIAAHEMDLRASLERQGLTLERLVVNQDSERQQRFARPQRPPAPPGRPRRRAPGAEIEDFLIPMFLE